MTGHNARTSGGETKKKESSVSTCDNSKSMRFVDKSVHMFDQRNLTSGGVGAPVHKLDGHKWFLDKASIFRRAAEDGFLNIWDYEGNNGINFQTPCTCSNVEGSQGRLSSKQCVYSLLPLEASGLMMPQGGILNALYIYHSHDIPRGLLATTFLLGVFNYLSSFQIYSMPIFDSFEAGYRSRTNRPCLIWVRSGFRVFYGFISFFIEVALPFLSSLAGILGGLTLPQFVGIMESKTWIWNRKSTGNNIKKGKTLELEKSVENLNEQLSSVCSESNAKDDLLAKQAKVAEETISATSKPRCGLLAKCRQQQATLASMQATTWLAVLARLASLAPGKVYKETLSGIKRAE
ncbi:hypothetical protein ZIOFF_000950 [Zingiber officinale]|uniref:Uncharacterized protein n=1 Tax=Zingiber officinale TaxID=94328 RepID=A0A8J5LRQ6_ZINOF|nr:hypothetical protein ZIOFF_000950 [Zingiber officinale]